jgi:hypothetical protein
VTLLSNHLLAEARVRYPDLRIWLTPEWSITWSPIDGIYRFYDALERCRIALHQDEAGGPPQGDTQPGMQTAPPPAGRGDEE